MAPLDSLHLPPCQMMSRARFHETLRRVVAQDSMRNASYLATRCKNDFTKLTMSSMHRKLLDNYAEHVARYDDRYSRLRMRRVNLIIRKCVQNGVDAACRSRSSQSSQSQKTETVPRQDKPPRQSHR